MKISLNTTHTAQQQHAAKSHTQHHTNFFQTLLQQDKTEQENTLSNTYNAWRLEYQTGGISQDMSLKIDEHSVNYINIMQKAVNEEGYSNPRKFLESLSTKELEAVQHTHALADPINPQNLTEEGALNLLLPRNHAQDLNNDGITMNGLAQGWQFPPVNAPQHIHEAWGEATKDMSDSERLLSMGSFLTLSVGLNIEYDSKGTPQDIYDPEHSKFSNPFAVEGFSYIDMLKTRLESLEYFKPQTSPKQYEQQKNLYTKFLDALQA